tara:strand:+ start:1723 stop:2694 length:972 start_codon:yes stop_codon:yes gene_type:complete
MAVVFGRNSFVLLAKETTWGSAGSYETNATRIISTTLQRSQQRDKKNHLSTSNGVYSQGTFDTFEETGGSLEVPLYYEGSGMFLRALAGNVATTGSGPYVHTYSSDSADLAAKSFSCKLQRGSATVGMEEFLGCCASSGTISITAGEEATISMEIIAKTSNARDSSITPTYNTTQTNVQHYEAGTISFNGVNYEVNSMEFSVENSLERRNILGSKFTASPDVTSFRDCTITVEMVVQNAQANNLYNASIAGTESPVIIHFSETGGTDIMSFFLNNAIITDISEPLNTVGRLTVSCTFTALASPSGTAAWKIEVTNNQPNDWDS